MKVSFYGATGTVTGSRFLVEAGQARVLIDSGLYQGLKELRQRNWARPPFDPTTLDAVVLTHAHIDHTGSLPRLVKLGYRQAVHGTAATCDLAEILLPDSAHLQEEEARFANKKGFSKHSPAQPLYGEEDAAAACKLLHPHPYGEWFEVAPGVSVQYIRAGHILGSAHVLLRADGTTIAFSGDVGRFVAPVMPPPTALARVDLLVCESTYGDRLHPETDVAADLARVVNDTVRRGGALIIPAFAVGRTQEILYVLRELETAKKIPTLPVYLDSPMAQKTTQLYLQHHEDLDDEMLAALRTMEDPLATANLTYVRDQHQSKQLNDVKGPLIIVSASGMATGGRVLHHLRARLPDPRTTVLLSGFQAAGTRGRLLKEGARALKMLGEEVAVRATIESISGFSAHADQGELLRWIESGVAPRTLALVHGEPPATTALAERLRQAHFANVVVPSYQQTLDV